jgi:eukaryotic-like serine/threonine-protein kinase
MDAAEVLGENAGGYVLQRLLGEGAVGFVYEAFPHRGGEAVAVKVYKDWIFEKNAAVQEERIAREASVDVVHSGVCRMIAHGKQQIAGKERCYLVMEFIQGEPLDGSIKRTGPLTWRDFYDASRQLLSACAAMHAQDLVHRDIKPANILRTSSGRLVLLDFGIVADMEEATLTQPHHFLGTTRYAPPESLFRRPPEAATRPAVDVYSLGATFLEMITGRPPFPEIRNSYELAQAIEKLPPAVEVAGYPRAVVRLVRYMLAKDPASRPSLAECVATIESANAGDIETERATPSLANFREMVSIRGIAATHEEARSQLKTRDQWNDVWLKTIYPPWELPAKKIGAEAGVESVSMGHARLLLKDSKNYDDFAKEYPDHAWTFCLYIEVKVVEGLSGVFIAYLFAGTVANTSLIRVVGRGGTNRIIDLDSAHIWSGSLKLVGEKAALDVPRAANLLEAALADANQGV